LCKNTYFCKKSYDNLKKHRTFAIRFTKDEKETTNPYPRILRIIAAAMGCRKQTFTDKYTEGFMY
jgi:hypothetical protein